MEKEDFNEVQQAANEISDSLQILNRNVSLCETVAELSRVLHFIRRVQNDATLFSFDFKIKNENFAEENCNQLAQFTITSHTMHDFSIFDNFWCIHIKSSSKPHFTLENELKLKCFGDFTLEIPLLNLNWVFSNEAASKDAYKTEEIKNYLETIRIYLQCESYHFKWLWCEFCLDAIDWSQFTPCLRVAWCSVPPSNSFEAEGRYENFVCQFISFPFTQDDARDAFLMIFCSKFEPHRVKFVKNCERAIGCLGNFQWEVLMKPAPKSFVSDSKANFILLLRASFEIAPFMGCALENRASNLLQVLYKST